MRKCLLLSVMMLCACTGNPKQYTIDTSTPPAEAMVCSPRPEAPANDGLDAYRAWATKLYYAWLDCFEKLQAVKDFHEKKETQH